MRVRTSLSLCKFTLSGTMARHVHRIKTLHLTLFHWAAPQRVTHDNTTVARLKTFLNVLKSSVARSKSNQRGAAELVAFLDEEPASQDADVARQHTSLHKALMT